MIIAVGGLTGSGKNTLGEKLAQRLGLRLVCPTFKDLAAKEGVPLMEFQKRAEKDKKIDLKFDELLREEAAKGGCVVTTWLGPWMLDADVRIWVFAPLKVRSERLAKRDNMSVPEAEKHIVEREARNAKRYKKLYKIDISDTSSFDCCLSSAIYAPDELADIAMLAIGKKKAKDKA